MTGGRRKLTPRRNRAKPAEPDGVAAIDRLPSAHAGKQQKGTDPVNMMTAIQARALGATVAPVLHQVQATSLWQDAVADYTAKRDYERGLPIENPRGDDAVEAACQARDHLIESISAPDAEAVQIKLEIARACSADFVGGLFDDHRTAILADLRRLAGETPDEIADTPQRGTHAICEDERGVFVGLPDLETGRTLQQAIQYLDGIQSVDPEIYPDEWLAELVDVGGDASANYTNEGRRHLYIGQPCDRQEEERRLRINALFDHMLTIDGMYERVADLLERRGRYTDNRPSNLSETTAALRDFILAGFRVFIRPDGRLGTSGGMPQEWAKASFERMREIEQAGRRFDAVLHRHRNGAHIKRAVRVIGTLHEGSGCIVLERQER